MLWSDQPLAGGASPAGEQPLSAPRRRQHRRADHSRRRSAWTPAASLAGASRDFSRLFLDTNVKQHGRRPAAERQPLRILGRGSCASSRSFPKPSKNRRPPAASCPRACCPPVSEDGSQVIFKANLYPGLFLRSDHVKSVEVSETQKNPANINPPADAKAVGVAADGSEVFFTSASELTDDAYTGRTAGVPNNAGADLYSYDVSSGVLTDLTVDTEAGRRRDRRRRRGSARRLAQWRVPLLRRPRQTGDGRDLGAAEPLRRARRRRSNSSPPTPRPASTSTSPPTACTPPSPPAPRTAATTTPATPRPTATPTAPGSSAHPAGPTANRRRPAASIAGRALSDDGDSPLLPERRRGPARRPERRCPTSTSTSTARSHLLTPGEGDPAILLGG